MDVYLKCTDTQVDHDVTRGIVSKISFVSLGVVCNQFSDGVRYVGLYDFINEFFYIHIMNVLAGGALG